MCCWRLAESDTSDNTKQRGLSTREIIKKGSIIGAIVTGPSLVVFYLVWLVLDDIMIGAIAGVIVHFIAMGFSLKISKRLLMGGDDKGSSAS